MQKFYKRTKIVATLGPASESEENIRELILNGVNVFRLNTSHGTQEEHKQRFNNVRKIAKELDVFVGIIIDLQGPKIRLGNLKEDIPLKNGQELVFQHTADYINGIIPVDYSGIAKDVKSGDKMLIDDGKIVLEVLKTENEKVYAKVLNDGILKSRKGLNIPGSTSSLDAVTKRDIEFIKFAVENNADYIALSFVREKSDIEQAKKYIKEFGGSCAIISKIEKPQAIKNLDEIISVSDCIMVARGDLGIELSPVDISLHQKNIIKKANEYKTPVIVATQMLETMINEPIPTRAESSDVANAILDGADAVMLSAETSVGKYPVLAVKTMSEIAHSIENSNFYKYDIEEDVVDVRNALTRRAVVFAADKMIKYVNAKAMLSFSHAGYSSCLLSKLKPSVPIITISDEEATCRKLALAWGVYPYVKKWDNIVSRDLLEEINEFLKKEFGFQKDDYVIITGSAPYLISGRTNFVRVHRIDAEKDSLTSIN